MDEDGSSGKFEIIIKYTTHEISVVPLRCVVVDPSVIVMDEQVFARPICQRVYQYLRRHMGNYNLDSFSYAGNVEGNRKNCLEIFLQ